MANLDRPFGFKLITPFNPNYMQYYPVATAYGTAIFKGDFVQLEATVAGYKCAALNGSTRPGAVIDVTGAAGESLGVVMAVFDSDLLPLMYLPASTTGDGVVAGYLLVNTDPDALYVVQEDSDGGAIAADSVGLNIDAVSTHSGNTLTGQSKMEIDSSTVATTATLAWKLVRSWEDDTVASANCRWVVKLNTAAMGDNIVGVA